MLCIKKSYFLSIFALFAVLFGSFIFTSGNVSAVDINTTINTNTTNVFLCDDNDSNLSNCPDYLYLHDGQGSGGRVSLLCSFTSPNGSNRTIEFFYFIPFQSYLVSDISFCSSIKTNGFFLWFSDTSFIVTLTDDDPLSSSSCPTCPEIPDNPYDPKFDEIKQAILIIPATALVIYFFFCIYRMLLKGRE